MLTVHSAPDEAFMPERHGALSKDLTFWYVWNPDVLELFFDQCNIKSESYLK